MHASVLKIDDFGDGLNTKMPQEKLLPSEAFSVYNLRTIGGTLYPRKDKVEIGGTIPNIPIHSQTIFKQAGSKYHIIGCGQDVYIRTITDSSWWNSTWAYRVTNGILVVNTDTKSEAGYIVWVKLAATFDYSKAQSNGEDIRFIFNGQELPYWIETWGAGATPTASYIAVKIDISARSSYKFDMYVGNPTAMAKSNRNGMFLIDDNFETNPFTEPARVDVTAPVSDLFMWDAVEKAVGCTHWDEEYRYGYATYKGFRAREGTIFIRAKSRSSAYYDIGGLWRKDGASSTTAAMVYDNSLQEKKWLWLFDGNLTTDRFEWDEYTWYGLELQFKDLKLVFNIYSDDAMGLHKGDVPLMTLNADRSPTGNDSAVGFMIGGRSRIFLLKDFVFIPCNPLITISNLSTLEQAGAGENWTKAFLPDGVTSIFTSSSQWETVTIRNLNFIDKIIFANGVDIPRVWDGIIWEVWDATHGLNKAVKHITFYKGRLFAANATGGEASRLYYCNVSSQGVPVFEETNDWKTAESLISGGTQYVDNYEDFLGDGEEITGLVPSMFDGLLVMKPDGMTLFYGNTPDNWGKKKLPQPFGCIAPRSLIKYNDILFFVSKIGVHYMVGESGNASAFTFDNIQANSLTEKIEDVFFSQVLSSAIGAVWDSKYYLFFPQTITPKCFVLDWRRKSWWVDLTENITSAIIDSDTNVFYSGAADGKIYNYEIATGVIATNEWTSGILQALPNWEVRIRQIFISYRGNVKITVITNRETFSFQINAINNSHNQTKINCNILGRQMQIKLENLTGSVEGIEMSIIPLRRV